MTPKLNGRAVAAGDPYIMKFNGTYYLYPSNYDNYAWKSEDMVNWTHIGTVFTGPNSTNLYAPEVAYRNGYFYCYSCPEGTTNYLYRSESPEGPFTTVSGALGMGIDATTFRDDDGSLYLSHAAWNYLALYELDAPDKVGKQMKNIPVSVSGKWTEGPTFFKRGDTYYLTYTGNHVLDYSYRIEYAYSNSLTSGWKEPVNNLLMLSTEGDIRGTGHNSIVIGPDLDTYYIVYHDIISPGSSVRRIDIDRVFWNGIKPCVTMTSDEVEDPAMPDFEERYAGDFGSWDIEGKLVAEKSCKASLSGSMLSKVSTEDVYTAEFNLIPEGAAICFSYADENNNCKIYFSDKAMYYTALVSGAEVQKETIALPDDTDLSVLQCVRVQQTEEGLSVFFEGARKFQTSVRGGGKIGVFAEDGATVGYIAFSNIAMGSKDCSAPKYLPATLEAVLANNAAELMITQSEELGYAVRLNENQTIRFETTSFEDTDLSLILRGRSVKGAVLNIAIDGEPVATGFVFEGSLRYRREILRAVSMTAGSHTIEITVQSGSLELYQLGVDKYVTVEPLYYDMDKPPAKMAYYNGKQRLADSRFVLSSTTYTLANHSETLLGDMAWSDYSVEVTMKSEAVKAGIFLRSLCTTSPVENNSPTCYQEYYQRCYFVSMENEKVVLYKYNFDSKVLASAIVEADFSVDHVLKATAVGAVITVYLDGEKVLAYTDTSSPYLHGKMGFKVVEGTASYDDLTIAPLVLENTYRKADGTTFTSAVPPAAENGPSENHAVLYAVLAGFAILVATIAIFLLRKRRGV